MVMKMRYPELIIGISLPSTVIRGRQRSLGVIRGHQRSLGVFRSVGSCNLAGNYQMISSPLPPPLPLPFSPTPSDIDYTYRVRRVSYVSYCSKQVQPLASLEEVVSHPGSQPKWRLLRKRHCVRVEFEQAGSLGWCRYC